MEDEEEMREGRGRGGSGRRGGGQGRTRKRAYEDVQKQGLDRLFFSRTRETSGVRRRMKIAEVLKAARPPRHRYLLCLAEKSK